MLVKIKSIKVDSLCKVFGVLQGIVGLVTGILFTLIYIVDPAFLQSGNGTMASVFGLWSFIVLPVLNGVLGFLTGAVISLVYNKCVQHLNVGIEFDLEGVKANV